jgi:hypothetical protein
MAFAGFKGGRQKIAKSCRVGAENAPKDGKGHYPSKVKKRLKALFPGQSFGASRQAAGHNHSCNSTCTSPGRVIRPRTASFWE